MSSRSADDGWAREPDTELGRSDLSYALDGTTPVLNEVRWSKLWTALFRRTMIAQGPPDDVPLGAPMTWTHKSGLVQMRVEADGDTTWWERETTRDEWASVTT